MGPDPPPFEFAIQWNKMGEQDTVKGTLPALVLFLEDKKRYASGQDTLSDTEHLGKFGSRLAKPLCHGTLYLGIVQ